MSLGYEEIIARAGPAAGTLALMGMIVRWLLTDRRELLRLLDESRAEASKLREARVSELREASTMLAESSEVVRDALQGVESRVRDLQVVLDTLRGTNVAGSANIEKALTRCEEALRELTRTVSGGQTWGSKN